MAAAASGALTRFVSSCRTATIRSKPAIRTRTSSPIRIKRNDNDLQSLNTRGLFPAGEGAGYAGGIMSAAVDGIRVAEAVALAMAA